MASHAHRLRRPMFLALVAVLPLHTVFVRWEIAWKPWLILLIAVVAIDLVATRGLAWPGRLTAGTGLFLLATLVSWPGPGSSASFWRLWLALVAGILLLLSAGIRDRDLEAILRVVFWSAAAIGVTAFIVAVVTNGAFGERAVDGINDLVLVEKVNKRAYLGSGFIAITNWHQDPGYAALWTNIWLVLSAFAWTRGLIRGPRWVGPLVIGGLAAAAFMTYSRTGWIGLLVAATAVAVAHWRQGRASFRRAVGLLLAGGLVALALLAIQLAVDRPDIGGDMAASVEFRLAYILELGAVDTGEIGIVDPNLVVPDNRLDVWSEYWDRFLENPIRGIGLGTGWGEEGLQEPHNLWLELLAETGLIGLTGFLAMLVALGSRGGREAASALVVVGVATLSQTVLFEPALWFALGLWAAGSRSTATSSRS